MLRIAAAALLGLTLLSLTLLSLALPALALLTLLALALLARASLAATLALLLGRWRLTSVGGAAQERQSDSQRGSARQNIHRHDVRPVSKGERY